ncbi:uncharacterized protein Dvir_GJ26960 [Drosophila virilis]|uniref:Uncharacterized protein n=1 Tax=Drosophila virilis TaxID=7244 RepID=A0A0Q9WPL2_DROVI|nr:uncharacterized protein LOC26531730 [Drosophila virilis]KRF83297.1 uncharacterized protein Dvir_GJ26960 [Drosophila virilis]
MQITLCALFLIHSLGMVLLVVAEDDFPRISLDMIPKVRYPALKLPQPKRVKPFLRYRNDSKVMPLSKHLSQRERLTIFEDCQSIGGLCKVPEECCTLKCLKLSKLCVI